MDQDFRLPARYVKPPSKRTTWPSLASDEADRADPRASSEDSAAHGSDMEKNIDLAAGITAETTTPAHERGSEKISGSTLLVAIYTALLIVVGLSLADPLITNVTPSESPTFMAVLIAAGIISVAATALIVAFSGKRW